MLQSETFPCYPPFRIRSPTLLCTAYKPPLTLPASWPSGHQCKVFFLGPQPTVWSEAAMPPSWAPVGLATFSSFSQPTPVYLLRCLPQCRMREIKHLSFQTHHCTLYRSLRALTALCRNGLLLCPPALLGHTRCSLSLPLAFLTWAKVKSFWAMSVW